MSMRRTVTIHCLCMYRLYPYIHQEGISRNGVDLGFEIVCVRIYENHEFNEYDEYEEESSNDSSLVYV